MIIQKIKEMIPPQLKWRIKAYINLAIFIPNYTYDSVRFAMFSGTLNPKKNQARLEASILKEAHRIEKGLSLSKPKPRFGIKVIQNLAYLLLIHKKKFNNPELYELSINTLTAYSHFHKTINEDTSWIDSVTHELKHALNFQGTPPLPGGTISICKSEINSRAKSNFLELANSRHSIRQFTKNAIPDETIKEAVEIALKTPSVCNRQTAKVYSFSKTDDKKRILSLQNGNTGFGDQASHILIVTSKLACFEGASERNQAFVDGGLMAMSLVYALHYLGVGTCFLNWSSTANRNIKLHKVSGIPHDEIIITLIAAGEMPERLLVAESPRKSLEEILILS
ncbi:nitroreductase family protein [Pseudomonas sp. QL9]|uniref:nitroreductase family protein n=1 Tax=Pseudomonas sp. QL9 TaxID=3242725 RepID=UPI00352A3AC1